MPFPNVILYDVDTEHPNTHLRILTTVLGVLNRYRVGKEVRYAVFEEADCEMRPEDAVAIIDEAAEEAWGAPAALIVRTKKGYHAWAKHYRTSFMEAVIDMGRFREALPAACRDYRHTAFALRILMEHKAERLVLRVSPTKYMRDFMQIIKFDVSGVERHHAELLWYVRQLYVPKRVAFY